MKFPKGTAPNADTFGYYLQHLYPSLPMHRVYERIATEYFSSDYLATHNKKVMGAYSNKRRQIDVWLASKEKPNHLLEIVECKAKRRKLDITEIDHLWSIMQDVGAGSAQLLSPIGFAGGVKDYAQRVGIKTLVLRPSEALLEIWARDGKREKCHECSWDDSDRVPFVWWNWGRSAEKPRFGVCQKCGTIHFGCPFCLNTTAANAGEDVIQCEGCGAIHARYALNSGKDFHTEPHYKVILLSALEGRLLSHLTVRPKRLVELLDLDDLRPFKKDAVFVLRCALSKLRSFGFIQTRQDLVRLSKDFDCLVSLWEIRESLHNLK